MPWYDDMHLAWLRLYNRVDYPLRQFFHWHRPGFQISAQNQAGLYEALTGKNRARAEELAAHLLHDYHLHDFRKSSAPRNYRENLFYLDMLARALKEAAVNFPNGCVEAADIGPSHWFYVQALYAALKWAPFSQKLPQIGEQGRRVHLTGFEADAYRVYADFHSRYDHALGHMRRLEGVEYLPQAFTCQPGRYDLITFFFPFVFERDHLEWGLPPALFSPQRLLAAAWDSLKPGAALVIVNQGEAEHRAQLDLLASLGIHPLCAFRQDPLLYTYERDPVGHNLDRYVLTVRHD